MITNDTDRINHLLWLLMKFDIHRYLMSNADGRWDGAEKAERHINLSYIYVASRHGTPIDLAARIRFGEGIGKMLYSHIHDGTTPLTDYMDEVIGFPLEGRPEYDELAPKFFKEFIRLADIAYAEVENKIIDTGDQYKSAHLRGES
jgi:hypothetical protein